MFERGEDKFINEFDAIKFVKMSRNLKMIVASMMNDDQRFIASYQKINTIAYDSKSSSDSIYSDQGSKVI
jgi:hypothetical protein